MTQTIGFIGLGSMGAGMTRNLLKAGYRVQGYDVDFSRADALRADGVEAARTPAQAADGADILGVCVFNQAQAEAALFGENGACERLAAGSTVMMHTTMSPGAASALEQRLTEAGYRLVDAPVTGGKQGADDGTLTIIASGTDAAMATVEKAFEAMGRRVYRIGEAAGAASQVKMINQLLVGVNSIAAIEAITLATKAGADPNVVYDVITHGGGNSVSFKTRIPFILEEDFDPRGIVEIFTKGLSIVAEAAAALGVDVPLTQAALAQFEAAVAAGWGKLDDSAVVKVYEARSGVNVAAAARAAGDDAADGP